MLDMDAGGTAEINFLQTLGITIKEIGDRYAEMAVTVDARHLNYMGGAHGGLISALVDTVCFFPQPLLPSGRKLTTVDLKVSYIRPAGEGDRLVARSELLHLGRRTASLTVQILDQERRLIAHGSVTLLLLS